MRYIGGKSRIKKDLHAIFNEKAKGKVFVDMFCGSCKVVEGITTASKKYAVDNNPHMIKLFTELIKGWEPPDAVTKEQYTFHRLNLPDTPLTAFIGHGLSFSGRWFSGFIGNKSDRNYVSNAKNSLLKQVNLLKDVEFVHGSYDSVSIPKGSIVYCDPPYKGTKKLYYSDSFNRDDFFKWAKDNKDNYEIYISEYKSNVPSGFSIVWEKESTKDLKNAKGERECTVEVLCVPN